MPKRSSKQTDEWNFATINDIETGELRLVEVPSSRDRVRPENDPAAVERGRRGGLKSLPKKRMESLTEQDRSELRKLAARQRWQKLKIKVKVKE